MLRTVIRLAVLLSIGLFSIQAALAQGTYQFIWHGNSNFFQASFEVTDAEMQPGAVWNSPLFYNSIAITSPSGVTYHYGGPADWAAGGCYANGTGWNFGAGLVDFANGTQVSAGGQEYDGGGGVIQEQPISGPNLWFENGYWTTLYVPEPSTAALLAVAATGWAAKRSGGFLNRQ
jgi:hypothetical protein